METGVQRLYKYLKKLDSGFRRNDRKPHFQTFYNSIKIDKQALKMKQMLLILLLVFSFGPLFHGPGAASSEKIVKVGLVGSWIGSLGVMGQMSKPGALLAQKHINEEGKFIGTSSQLLK